MQTMPRSEYPRPQFARPTWMNLNGSWQFEIDHGASGRARGMVEKNAYCPDILAQVAAANAALNSFNKVLLGNHIRTCVAEDIRQGKDETIDELVTLLQKLMK